MKQILLIFCALCGWLYAQINRTITIEGMQSPQAVVMTTLNAFVSNLGSNPNATKNGSGFISKTDRAGKVVDSQFIGNLNAPYGMAIIDNILYVVDVNMLKGFNLATKKQVLNLPISGSSALRDVVAKDSQTLLIADGENGLVLLVDLRKKSYYTFVTIENALGAIQSMAIDKKYLYVSTFDKQDMRSRIVRIQLDSKEKSIVREFDEQISAITLTENGGILAASWGTNDEGRFYKITKNATYLIDLDVELKSPTKFWHDSQTLWVPDSDGNVIQKITPE